MMRQAAAPRILYIDNQRRSGGGLVSMLRRAKNHRFSVSTASTPDEALERLAGEPFDLLILDHQLSDMSGVELCRRIRRTDKKTPILFFGDRTRAVDGDVSIAAGATEYLVAPVSEENLVETIRRLLNDFRAAEPNNQSACCLAK